MMTNPFSLEGKTILVTGASSGIGRGIAVECSRMGAKVVINGRNEERLSETLSLMEGDGHISICADLSSPDGIGKIVTEVPMLDGYVNSAGTPSVLPIRNSTYDSLWAVINVNSVAPMTLLSLLIKNKKLNKNMSVIFLGSINGCSVGFAGSSTYAASKGALFGYIKAAALELAKKGGRVNMISPGVVPTNMMKKDEMLYTSDEIQNDMIKNYPMGRLGIVEDIAYGAVYLLSDASSWVTGQNLVIDGGYSVA